MGLSLGVLIPICTASQVSALFAILGWVTLLSTFLPDFIELMSLDFDFDDSQPQLLVIDEAQESTQLGSFVRQLKEDLKKTVTILTGSSMTRLFRTEQRVRNMPFPRLSILDTADQALRTQLGGLFENAVLLNMMSFANGYPSISSWKKKSSLDVEVDFIWRVGNSLIPIECKAVLKATPRSFASLRQYAKESGQIFGILVSAAPFSEVREGKLCLINIPIYAAVPDLIFSLVNR